MDEVAESGKELVVTKNGRPVARPARFRKRPETFFGRDRDRIHIPGDIIEPVAVKWEAGAGSRRTL